MKIYDISPLISDDLAVFPGDTPFSQKFLMEFGNNLLSLSTITSTTHLGSHADAPYHYNEKGSTIESQPLELYIGKAQVIEVPPGTKIINCDHLPKGSFCERVIFKTGSYDSSEWSPDFTSISPEVVSFLSEKCVKLIGIDTPSVDSATSKELPTHQMFFKKNINIIEGLELSKVSKGIYFFIGLPLKIKKGDASPIRAVLIDGIEDIL